MYDTKYDVCMYDTKYDVCMYDMCMNMNERGIYATNQSDRYLGTYAYYQYRKGNCCLYGRNNNLLNT